MEMHIPVFCQCVNPTFNKSKEEKIMQYQTRDSKKPYLEPKFSIYGSVSTLTLQSGMNGGVTDNQTGPLKSQ